MLTNNDNNNSCRALKFSIHLFSIILTVCNNFNRIYLFACSLIFFDARFTLGPNILLQKRISVFKVYGQINICLKICFLAGINYHLQLNEKNNKKRKR